MPAYHVVLEKRLLNGCSSCLKVSPTILLSIKFFFQFHIIFASIIVGGVAAHWIFHGSCNQEVTGSTLSWMRLCNDCLQIVRSLFADIAKQYDLVSGWS